MAEPFCGGSIITSSHILTAAHCTFDSKIDDVKEPEAIKVLVGMHRTSDLTDVKMLGISSITNHPKFNNNEGDYDYSILTYLLYIFATQICNFLSMQFTELVHFGQIWKICPENLK